MPHAPELTSPVRTLAQRLAAGRIAWPDYRQQRAELVEAIVRGDTPLTYEKAEVFADATLPKEHELGQVLIDLNELEGNAPRRWPAIVAVAVLALVIVTAGWAAWRSLQPPVVASAPVVEMSPAEGVLHRFLSADAWTAEALSETAESWQALDEDSRAEARRTATWRRVQHQLRERTNQQQVLASVDESGEATAQVQRLQAFQEALTR